MQTRKQLLEIKGITEAKLIKLLEACSRVIKSVNIRFFAKFMLQPSTHRFSAACFVV